MSTTSRIHPLRTTAVAAVAALSLGLAACGSSGSGGGSLSRADLVTKLNSICKQAETGLKNVATPNDLATNPKAASKYFDAIGPLSDKETSDVAALKPADDVKADFQDFLTKQQTANDLIQKIKGKADSADASGLQDLAKLPDLETPIEAAAKKIGNIDCT